MSTRSMILVRKSQGSSLKVVLSIYKHCDGYPEWTGVLLCKFLKDSKLTRGIDLTDADNKEIHIFNGTNDLATQLVTALKFEDVIMSDMYTYENGGFVFTNTNPVNDSFLINGIRPGGIYIYNLGSKTYKNLKEYYKKFCVEYLYIIDCYEDEGKIELSCYNLADKEPVNLFKVDNNTINNKFISLVEKIV